MNALGGYYTIDEKNFIEEFILANTSNFYNKF